jgi:hypothetical protein
MILELYFEGVELNLSFAGMIGNIWDIAITASLEIRLHVGDLDVRVDVRLAHVSLAE